MKERKPNLGLSKICRLFGVTRQAYYQYFERNIDTELEHELIITEVLKILDVFYTDVFTIKDSLTVSSDW